MAVDQTTTPKTRWNEITSGQLLAVLLAVEVILFLFEPWFPKGWAILFALGCVTVVSVYLLYRFAYALISDRPFQYSVRSLLILTAVIALTVGWMTRNLEQAARQARVFGPHFGGKGEGIPSAPAWLCDIFGEQFFIDAGKISFLNYSYESDATEADLEFLKEMPRLDSFIIRTPGITESALLENLKGLKKLNSLVIDGIPLTDAGLEKLKELDKLQGLWLVNTRVTGTGLEHLKLDRVNDFALEGTKISEEGWKVIQGFNQLQILLLCDSGATDSRLEFLKSQKNIWFLDLSENPITDAMVEHLKGMEKMKYLYLSKTDITDASIPYLKGLEKLEGLRLDGTKITSAGMTELQSALPKCKF